MGYQVGFSFYSVLLCINEDTDNQRTQQPVTQGGRSPQKWGWRGEGIFCPFHLQEGSLSFRLLSHTPFLMPICWPTLTTWSASLPLTSDTALTPWPYHLSASLKHQ